MKEMRKIGKDSEQCSLLPSSKFSTQPQDTLHPLFHPIWSRFQHDIYSYISPALSPAQPPTSLPLQKPKHKFNMALSIRELKKSITINNGIDIFTQIRKQITRIFYRVAHAFVNQCFRVGAQCEDSDSDYVQAVVDVYDRVKGRIGVLLDCLFLVVGRFITKSGIQEELYSIINKEMVNHHNYESFITSCLNQLQSLRNSYLKPQTPPISTLIPHLALLIKLKIFPYPEYLQRSKKYYSELLPKIPTNIWMFSIVYNLIQCQKMLQTIIVPTQEQLEATRKSLRMQGWRALEQESVVDVLEKEVLVQIFDDMIQYVDYLVGGEVEREVGKESEMQQQRHQRNIKKVEYIMTTTQKNQFLKHLWQLTKQLQKSHKHHHNHLHRHHKSQVSNKIQNISPYEKLLNRICQIVGDIKKFINPQKNNNLCQIYKVVYFKQHVLDIVQQCFYADAKFVNAVTTKIYDTIQEQQQVYNSKLCSIILNPNYTYPSHSIPTSPTTSTISPQTQNSLLSPQLFKLTPSKQHFISKFQQQFSNYILTNWNSSMNLNEQQKFIKPIQMQIGHSLARNIERMITDVWRNGCLIEHRIGNVYCRVLGSYWPKLGQAKFRLADGLLEVRADFEVGFLGLAENDKKKLRWIQQYGIMRMKINQVQSTFSQLQGSIITLLNRSYRPLKPNQLKQILQSIMPLQPILSDLAQNNILLYNPQSNSYQLNYQNTQIYCFTRKQKFQSKIQKKQVERDNIIILEYSIARLLKRRKSVQKTDIAKILTNEMKIQNYVKQVCVEEINTALERLVAKDIAIIEKTRGIVKYLQ